MDAGGSDTDCPLQYLAEYNTCSYHQDWAINQVTERRCGAQIYVIPSGMDPADYSFKASQEDSDGDGLGNFDEYFYTNTDPCNAYSADTCRSDGEGDVDGDGIPDAEDPAKGCPGESAATCV